MTLSLMKTIAELPHSWQKISIDGKQCILLSVITMFIDAMLGCIDFFSNVGMQLIPYPADKIKFLR